MNLEQKVQEVEISGVSTTLFIVVVLHKVKMVVLHKVKIELMLTIMRTDQAGLMHQNFVQGQARKH